MLRNLVKEKDAAAMSNTSATAVATEQKRHEEDDMDGNLAGFDIPKSYEEIYRLSGKNRKKNKEKKRNRETDSSIETDTFLNDKDQMMMVVDGETELVDNEPDGLASEKKDGNFNIDEYFTADTSEKVDTSVDATVSCLIFNSHHEDYPFFQLKFVRDIGWLKSDAEMNDIKEEHLRVLAEQQSVEDTNEVSVV